MLARRIIPCLDVMVGKVVKGIRFADHEIVGECVTMAQHYRNAGALVFYDITASPERRKVVVRWIDKVAAVLDIPFCVAGGIRSIEDAAEILAAGADKISINSPALNDPDLINQLSDRFGRQCIVVGIDSYWDGKDWLVKALTGDPNKTITTKWKTTDWIVEAQKRGAGEIVLNCMGEDGRKSGYDIRQLAVMRKLCKVPLIASGGAGKSQDFAEVFNEANVDGALAASVFHYDTVSIADLKLYLRSQDIEVRQ